MECVQLAKQKSHQCISRKKRSDVSRGKRWIPGRRSGCQQGSQSKIKNGVSSSNANGNQNGTREQRLVVQSQNQKIWLEEKSITETCKGNCCFQASMAPPEPQEIRKGPYVWFEATKGAKAFSARKQE
jgi:hypothetical protein